MTNTHEAIASPETQRMIVDKIFTGGLTNGDFAVADEYLTADFKNHGSHDDSLTGPEAFKHTMRIQRSAFSDIKYEIVDFISEGERAAIRWIMRGKHTGPFLGVPATGLEVEHHAIIWFRFVGHRIAERWGIVDNFALLNFFKAHGFNQVPGAGKPGGPGGPGGPAPAGGPSTDPTSTGKA